ncbi:LamG-like jellyroll fold domain-containing protein [Phaeocystidibacter luteus]|uniref:T9SS type B sorting domain-containing protein n=1 Tax=Phaeocystidibacter luteus TaxID=911197 RepID=A0A6N6RFE3_9FLAO|nr:LamG-like jellyroll fold domain-containing protein [Phaeocystidibacter luteus]KAB2809784.1 T9SS type B sorting domain-containing protein [Phaeocystidibacter luteus]
MFKRIATIIFSLSVCGLFAQNNVGPGNALDFNGSGDYVDLGPNLQSMTLPITVCMWVNPDQASHKTVFASNATATQSTYHGVWLNVGSDRVGLHMGNGTGGFGSSSRSTYLVMFPNDFYGEWIHIAAVYRGIGNMDLYINGEIQSGSYSGTTAAWSNSFSGNAWLGKGQSDLTGYYTGEVDNFSVWGRELTITEIRDLMCSKHVGGQPDLLMAYDFNETAGATTFSNSGSAGASGTRVGPTTTQSTAPIGDTSVHAYAATGSGYFTNQSVTLTIANQDFTAAGLAMPSRGVHLYRIDNDPSISATGCTSPHAWGVWVSDFDFSNDDPFDVSASPSSIAESRDNIGDTWQTNPGPVTGITYQSEFIVSGSLTVQLLPEDTTVCPGETVPITLPNGLTYTWDDGSTSASRTLGPGTYIVTASSGGCSTEDTIVITEFTVNALPFTDTTTCDSVLFIAPAGTTVMWPDGGGGNRYLFPGTYVVSVTSGTCSFTQVITVGVSSPASISYFPVYNICDDEDLTFTIPSDYSTVDWSDGETGNTRVITESGTYDFTAYSACGTVTGSFEVFVEACQDLHLWIPTAFSPNGDGTNDYFFIPNLGGVDFRWRIINRWGAEIFATSDPDAFWDGTFRGEKVQDGAYVMIINYIDRSGTPQVKRQSLTVIH